jgi:uncharacterized protein VirK/YbjX
MKEVERSIYPLYDVTFDTLWEFKKAVDAAYEELGNVKIRGNYVEFYEVAYREKTPEEIESERRAELKYKAGVRKDWEATAKVYGWKYECE